jgi:hypothetical protein
VSRRATDRREGGSAPGLTADRASPRDSTLAADRRAVAAPAADGPAASTNTSALHLVLLAILLIGLALPVLSTATGLYDHLTHWGKLVHAVDGFCATFIFATLLLAWRDAASVDLTNELAGLLSIFAGIVFGVLWEIVEFIRDWVAYSDLQKSNTDTMTDLLCNDLAVIVAALLAVRLYTRVATATPRQTLGRTAQWLVDGPSRVLDHHGFTIMLVVAIAMAGSVAALWFAGRPVPGIPIP